MELRECTQWLKILKKKCWPGEPYYNALESVIQYIEEQPTFYQHGLDDAWKAAFKVVSTDADDREKLFGYSSWLDVKDLGPERVIEIIKGYNNSHANITVGDEIIVDKRIGLVTKVAENPLNSNSVIASGILDNGELFEMRAIKNSDKTGRHFDQIASILDDLKNSEEN